MSKDAGSMFQRPGCVEAGYRVRCQACPSVISTWGHSLAEFEAYLRARGWRWTHEWRLGKAWVCADCLRKVEIERKIQ